MSGWHFIFLAFAPALIKRKLAAEPHRRSPVTAEEVEEYRQRYGAIEVAYERCPHYDQAKARALTPPERP